MIEFGASSDFNAVALVAVSFVSFLAGYVLRKWPDKVQQYAEDIDGSFVLFTPETHKLVMDAAGIALWVLSLVALVVAGMTG